MTSEFANPRLGKLVEHRSHLPQRHKLVDDQISRVAPGRDAATGVSVLDEMRRCFGATAFTLSEWLPLLAANPELLVRFINSGGNTAPGKRAANGPCIEVRRDSSSVDRRHQGILHIESLNPFNNDSLLMVAALGRLLRNAALLDYEKRDQLPVLLTGVSWARRNKSVRATTLSTHQVEHGLQRNLECRQRLYRIADLIPIVCNVVGDSTQLALPHERLVNDGNIQEHVVRLMALVRTFWPHLYDRPLSESEKCELLEAGFGRSNAGGIHGSGADWNQLAGLFPRLCEVLPQAFGPHLVALQNVAIHQGRLSEDYFHYFFAQMYVQGPEFRDFLKLAPISERRFDDPMYAISPESCALDAVYLPHYRLAGTRMLPYSVEHIDLSTLPSEQVKSHMFALRECRAAETLPKLVSLLVSSTRQDVMRIFADSLSFYQLAIRRSGQSIALVESELEALEPALLDGLNATTARSALRAQALEWVASAFLSNRDDRLLPFYLRPFFWPAKPGRSEANSLELFHVARILHAIGEFVSIHTEL